MISLWWWKLWNYTEWNDIEVTTMKSPITTESGRVQVTSCTRDSPPSWRGRVQSRAGVPARPECARAAVWACRRAQCWWRGPTSWRREPGARSWERRSQTSCNTRLSACGEEGAAVEYSVNNKEYRIQKTQDATSVQNTEYKTSGWRYAGISMNMEK